MIGPAPEEEVEVSLRSQALAGALSLLKDREQKVLILRYGLGGGEKLRHFVASLAERRSGRRLFSAGFSARSRRSKAHFVVFRQSRLERRKGLGYAEFAPILSIFDKIILGKESAYGSGERDHFSQNWEIEALGRRDLASTPVPKNRAAGYTCRPTSLARYAT